MIAQTPARVLADEAGPDYISEVRVGMGSDAENYLTSEGFTVLKDENGEPVEFPVQVRESVTYYGTMNNTLIGTAFSPAGIIALIAGCAAIVGAVILLVMKKKKSKG